jgi:hypothetical protein
VPVLVDEILCASGSQRELKSKDAESGEKSDSTSPLSDDT